MLSKILSKRLGKMPLSNSNEALLSYFHQSWGLRPRSYDKTGLRPASVLVLVLYFWSCFQHCIVVPTRRCVT